MIFKIQLNKSWVSVAMVSLLMGVYGSPVSAAQEKSIDDYLDDARPYLHHSCESAWAATGESAEEYVAIINRFVAVIFINHDFDVSEIAEAPEADQKRLQLLFYNEVGKRCSDDPQRLLAGVVEGSLVYAFTEIQKEES
jgi:hypothetical protein